VAPGAVSLSRLLLRIFPSLTFKVTSSFILFWRQLLLIVACLKSTSCSVLTRAPRILLFTSSGLRAIPSSTHLLLRRQLSSEPIGVFQAPSGSRRHRFLRDFHVTKVMRAACLQAYPDPHHYMRRHLLSVSCPTPTEFLPPPVSKWPVLMMTTLRFVFGGPVRASPPT
jgi:hypothetical protein